MADAASRIETGVIDVLKNVSRRPIEPSLSSDLVADLGFDSLQVLELVAELEDTFDISIPLNDVPATRTVGQVVAQVAALVEQRASRLMPGLRTLVDALDEGAASGAGYTFLGDGGARTRSVRRRFARPLPRRLGPAARRPRAAATSSRSSSGTPSSS